VQKDKPRILMLIRDLQAVGGAQLNAIRLAARLNQIGYPVMLMGYGSLPSIRRHLARFKINLELPLLPIPAPSGQLIGKLAHYWPNIFFILPCFLRLLKHRRRFDILHGPLLMESGLLCALASIFLAKPSIVKIGSAGRYGDVRRASRASASGIRCRLFKRITKFVCLTKEIEDELVNQLKIPYEKIIRIPNGIDTRRFCPVNRKQKLKLRAELGFNSDGKIILFVGRLELKKRVQFLLKAWEKVQTARNGHDRLLIVGDGRLRPELEKLKDAMKSRATVTFFGESENITPIMQAADIFVLPSVSEGLANVLLESMASALPVIATNTRGNTEILKHNETALLFQEENIRDLSDAILYLIEHDAFASNLGENARRQAKECFNISSVVNEYNKLYYLLAQ
jgi:glycosyltransferase involved in cell wall biosynthesis